MALPPLIPPTPHADNRPHLDHAKILLDVYQHTAIVWMWVRILQCSLDFGGDVPNNMEWVENLSCIFLLNNKLLIRRPRRWVLNNGQGLTHNRMRDTVEPSDVRPFTPPLIYCIPTPINMWKDMEQIILEGHCYLLWLKKGARLNAFNNRLNQFKALTHIFIYFFKMWHMVTLVPSMSGIMNTLCVCTNSDLWRICLGVGWLRGFALSLPLVRLWLGVCDKSLNSFPLVF